MQKPNQTNKKQANGVSWVGGSTCEGVHGHMRELVLDRFRHSVDRLEHRTHWGSLLVGAQDTCQNEAAEGRGKAVTITFLKTVAAEVRTSTKRGARSHCVWLTSASMMAVSSGDLQ